MHRCLHIYAIKAHKNAGKYSLSKACTSRHGDLAKVRQELRRGERHRSLQPIQGACKGSGVLSLPRRSAACKPSQSWPQFEEVFLGMRCIVSETAKARNVPRLNVML